MEYEASRLICSPDSDSIIFIRPAHTRADPMGAAIIDGKRIADEVRRELRPRIAALKARGVTPGLAAVIVGDDPASILYVEMKCQACEEMGLRSVTLRLAAGTTGARLPPAGGGVDRGPPDPGGLLQQAP